MEFIQLPVDILYIQLLESLEIPDLLTLCRVNRRYAQVLRDPKTWWRLLEKDFNLVYRGSEPNTIYKYLYQRKLKGFATDSIYISQFGNYLGIINKKLKNIIINGDELILRGEEEQHPKVTFAINCIRIYIPETLLVFGIQNDFTSILDEILSITDQTYRSVSDSLKLFGKNKRCSFFSTELGSTLELDDHQMFIIPYNYG